MFYNPELSLLKTWELPRWMWSLRKRPYLPVSMEDRMLSKQVPSSQLPAASLDPVRDRSVSIPLDKGN